MSSSKNGAFVMVDFCVITDKNLDVFDKMTYVALCKFADREGKCFPSQNTLAALVGCARSRLRNSLDNLKGLNYLRVDSRVLDGKQRSNLYTLLPRENRTRVSTSAEGGLQKTHPGSQDGHITIFNITRSKEQDSGELPQCDAVAEKPQDSRKPALYPGRASEPPSPSFYKNQNTAPLEREMKHPPYEEVVESFKRHFPDQNPLTLNEANCMWMRVAALVHNELYTAQGWDDYFDGIAKSPFLSGDNDANWRPSVFWILLTKNIRKVKGGFFKRGGTWEQIVEQRMKVADLTEEDQKYVRDLIFNIKSNIKSREAA